MHRFPIPPFTPASVHGTVTPVAVTMRKAAVMAVVAEVSMAVRMSLPRP